MQIKRFFTDRFGRVRPITNPNHKPETGAAAQDKPQEQQVHYIDVRQEGFKDGVLEIDKKHFEAWIGYSEQLEAVKHKLNTLRTDLNRYMAQLIRTETEGERLQVEIAGNVEKLKHQEKLLQLQEEKKHQLLKDRALLREKLSNIHTHYGPVLALLFLLAGFALLAADYAISHAIVAKAFDMEDGYRSILFATGMAVMAFAIKPAIDRIFEKNYTEGDAKTKTRNHIFLGTVAILVLFSLAILGVFRGEADAGFKQMAA
ncbi:MAG: hypothetical protein LPK19_05725, partial [Hymenobacteraceae bacterium]|nr:hypothetical protein [Hymenobacteraceae bacterium]MDX5395701.1 hypothetical protein [Hymenobacteraceae bacterium]MDX5511753.1 hypothetical protein [Hymenobacteraceae bacterium]